MGATSRIKKSLGYASSSAFRNASEWWLGGIGGAVGWFILWLAGLGMDFAKAIPADPLMANAIVLVCCVVLGVITVFLVRLLYAPIHFLVEPSGGLRAYLRARFGIQMWPIILMASGIAAFVLLFGSGMALFVIQSSGGSTQQLAMAPVGDQSSGPVSPTNQPTSILSHKYTPREARSLIDDLPQLSEILKNSADLSSLSVLYMVSRYPPPQFWLRNVRQMGFAAAIEQLNAAIKKLDANSSAYEAFANAHSVFKEDLFQMAGKSISSPDLFDPAGVLLRDAVRSYLNALETIRRAQLPDDKMPDDLIVAVLQEQVRELKEAATTYSKRANDVLSIQVPKLRRETEVFLQ
jgi:hypothetical protein